MYEIFIVALLIYGFEYTLLASRLSLLKFTEVIIYLIYPFFLIHKLKSSSFLYYFVGVTSVFCLGLFVFFYLITWHSFDLFEKIYDYLLLCLRVLIFTISHYNNINTFILFNNIIYDRKSFKTRFLMCKVYYRFFFQDVTLVKSFVKYHIGLKNISVRYTL